MVIWDRQMHGVKYFLGKDHLMILSSNFKNSMTLKLTSIIKNHLMDISKEILSAKIIQILCFLNMSTILLHLNLANLF